MMIIETRDEWGEGGGDKGEKINDIFVN